MCSAILVRFCRSATFHHSNCQIALPTMIACIDYSGHRSFAAVPIVECAILVHSIESADSPIDLTVACGAGNSMVSAAVAKSDDSTAGDAASTRKRKRIA